MTNELSIPSGNHGVHTFGPILPPAGRPTHFAQIGDRRLLDFKGSAERLFGVELAIEGNSYEISPCVVKVSFGIRVFGFIEIEIPYLLLHAKQLTLPIWRRRVCDEGVCCHIGGPMRENKSECTN